MSAASALSTAALAIAVTMFVTWLISLVKKNASIVDIVWGLGYVIVAWVVHLRLHHATDRSTLLVERNRRRSTLHARAAVARQHK